MTIPDTAVPALIGALFGFLASLVKEAFDRRRNAKDRRRELKTAVRMVYAELMFQHRNPQQRSGGKIVAE